MKKLISFILMISVLCTLFLNLSVSASAATYYFQSVDDGVYTFKNIGTKKYMNTYAGGNYDGCKTTLWDYDGTSDEQYRVAHVGGGKYYIYAMSSSKGNDRVIDIYRGNKNKISSGMKLDIWKRSATETLAQEFYFEALTNGNYVIRVASNTNLCVTAEKNANGSQLVVKTYVSGDQMQQWAFCNKSGKVIDATYNTPSAACYAVGGVSYRKYISSSGTEMWKNAKTGAIASSETTKKLTKMYIAKVMMNADVLNEYMKLSKAYQNIYINSMFSDQLGTVIGKGSGILLNILAPNPVTGSTALTNVALDISGIKDPDTIKSAVILFVLAGYAQDVQDFGNAALRGINSNDYSTVMKAFDYYVNAVASFAAIDALAGDTVEALAKSTTTKALLRYAKNLVLGFADTVCIAEKTKLGSDITVNALEAAQSLGAMKAYNQKIAEYYNVLNKI